MRVDLAALKQDVTKGEVQVKHYTGARQIADVLQVLQVLQVL